MSTKDLLDALIPRAEQQHMYERALAASLLHHATRDALLFPTEVNWCRQRVYRNHAHRRGLRTEELDQIETQTREETARGL